MKRIQMLLCSSVLILSACSTPFDSTQKSNDLNNPQWQAITFGQSTDLNFGSTILPGKVGTNQVTVNGEPVQPGPVMDQFEIESRGGKLANSHEGGTFYYTKLPTDVNFTLSATIVLNQLGPETNSTPNHQEGVGIMIRDIIGQPRLNPQPEGLEEFPAASNMVMNLINANKKEKNGLVNITASYREGIYNPWGTFRNRMKKDEFIKGVPFGENKPYKMTLTRTNTGYSVSFDDGETKQTTEVKGANANIVEMQDPKNQYLGFFASRNAKATISNVKLTLSKANTVDAPRYQASIEKPVLQPQSSDRSTTDNYIVQSRANYAGLFSISQDGKVIVKDKQVMAGDMFSKETLLTKAETQFRVTYTPTEGPDNTPLSYDFTVKKVVVKDPMKLLVNPDGSNGRWTLTEAVELIAPGGTILLENGDYKGLTLTTALSGTPDKRKNLRANGSKVRFVGPYLHEASYWNVSGIEVIGAPTNIHGSHNSFDHIVTHNSPDTGFQISSPNKIGRALWASYNVISDSESYNNMDTSQINADGFAAKMRIGDGNTFIRCISHHNIDDGWDLFNKVEDGANGVVTIIDSIAFNNGQTIEVPVEGGTRGNGFKLGGEGLPVGHIVKNSLAFHNNMDGFTDNFNPGPFVMENNVSIDNQRFNFLFRKSPYAGSVKQGTFTNNKSYRFFVDSQYSDVVNAYKATNNAFISNGKTIDSNGKIIGNNTLSALKKAALVSKNENVPGKKEALALKALLDMKK